MRNPLILFLALNGAFVVGCVNARLAPERSQQPAQTRSTPVPDVESAGSLPPKPQVELSIEISEAHTPDGELETTLSLLATRDRETAWESILTVCEYGDAHSDIIDPRLLG